MSKFAQSPSPSRDDPQADQAAAAGNEDTILEQAREDFLRAEDVYRRTLERVASGANRARDVTMGDIIDGSLEFVRRHPVAGLLAVGFVSFLAGRATRR